MAELHRQHVMRHVERNHTTVPANPTRVIGASTQDVLDEPDAADAALVARRVAAGVSKGDSKFADAFDKLKAAVCDAMGLNKSVPLAGSGHQPIVSVIRMNDIPDSLWKNLGKGSAMKKALSGVVGASTGTGSSLAAGYDSNSATMKQGDALREQSLPKRMLVVQKPLTKEQIKRAVSLALAAGKLTGAEGIAVEYCLSVNRPIDPEVMAKLRGEGGSK